MCIEGENKMLQFIKILRLTNMLSKVSTHVKEQNSVFFVLINQI